MKTWKLVSGILSILFFVIVTFQSCAVGLASSIYQSNDTGGGIGFIVAIMMIAGGIVSIVTRNSAGKGGNIALMVLFGLGALLGLSQDKTIFKDLIVWGGWCAINVILAIVAIVKRNTSN